MLADRHRRHTVMIIFTFVQLNSRRQLQRADITDETVGSVSTEDSSASSRSSKSGKLNQSHDFLRCRLLLISSSAPMYASSQQSLCCINCGCSFFQRSILLQLDELSLYRCHFLKTSSFPDDATEWYPKEKVMFAKLKLLGAHPRYITSEEFKLNQAVKGGKNTQNMKAGLSHINKGGDIGGDLRLSIEQQVKELIDQATDSNLVGRIWSGWQPYV